MQVSRDVMGRWAFPFLPDTNVLHTEPSAPWATGSTYHYARGNVYRWVCGGSRCCAARLSMLASDWTRSHPAAAVTQHASGIITIYRIVTTCREHDVSVARGAVVGHDSCVGAHTVIEEDAQVSNRDRATMQFSK